MLPPMTQARHGGLWLGLALLVTLLATLPTLRNGFAQDGKQLVMIAGNEEAANPMVASVQPIASYFTSHYWKGAGVESNLYRPVTVLSFAVVRAALGIPLGDEALAQHLVDVGLHVLATMLVWWILRRLGASHVAATLGTAVFGVHAIHAEAITSVVGRAELLGFVGGAVGTTCALRRGVLATLLATVAFFVAFCSKESALPWVVFAPLATWLGLAEPGARRNAIVRAAACALVAAAAFLALRAVALAEVLDRARESHAVNPLLVVGATERIATAFVVWVEALGKTLVPVSLVSDYGGHTFPLRTGFGDPVVLASIALLVACASATLVALRRAPLLALAGAAFLGFTLPTSNVPFATGTIFAERLLYTPSLLCPLVVAWVVARTHGRVRTTVAIVTAAWIAGSAWLLAARIADWRDERTLHVRDAIANPLSSRLQTSAGEVLYGEGQLERAIEFTRRAVELDPEAAGGWNNLGSMLLDKSATVEAEAALRRGLAARHRSDAELRLLKLNLARALRAAARPTDAAREVDELLRAAPDFLPAVLFGLEIAGERPDEARVAELLALGERLAPRAAPWALHRGLAALRRNDAQAARRELEAVIRAGYEVERARAALARIAPR